MKRVLALLIAAVTVVSVLMLAGCSLSKKAITVDEFKSKMEKNKFEIVDIKGDGISESNGFKAWTAAKKDEYHLEFYELESAELAARFYDNNVETAKDEGGVSTSSTISGQNYSKFSGTGAEYYYLISRVENTVLFIKVDPKYSDNVKADAELIGY